MPGRDLPLEEPMLNRHHGEHTDDGLLLDRRFRGNHDPGQAADGLLLEDVLGRATPAGLTCPANHLQGQDGVSIV